MARLLQFPRQESAHTETPQVLRDLGRNLYCLARLHPASVLAVARWVQFLVSLYTQSDEAS